MAQKNGQAGKRTFVPEILLVFFLVASRAAWIFWIGPGRIESPDIIEYSALSDRILDGNFNMSLFRFIRSPGLPVLIALLRSSFEQNWQIALGFCNLVFTVGTGLLLYLLVSGLEGGRREARWVLALYAFHLPLMAFTATVCSEVPSLFFSLASFVAFRRAIEKPSVALGALTGVLLYAGAAFRMAIAASFPVFLLAPLWLALQGRRRIAGAFAAGLVGFFGCTLPFGLYNLANHGSYVFSSNGSSFMFLNGNSEVGYLDAVRFGSLSQDEKYFVANFSEYGERFFGPRYSAALLSSEPVKQAIFREMAFEWIRKNPGKFISVKLSNFFRVLIPGTSWSHVSFRSWIGSVLAGLPVYLLAYLGILLMIRRRGDLTFGHACVLALIGTNGVPLVALLFTYRYKIYGYEYLLLVPAAHAASYISAKWAEGRKTGRCSF